MSASARSNASVTRSTSLSDKKTIPLRAKNRPPPISVTTENWSEWALRAAWSLADA